MDGAPVAAVVNQVFAEKYFHGENPVGRHFSLGGNTNATDVEIVGIARIRKTTANGLWNPETVVCIV